MLHDPDAFAALAQEMRRTGPEPVPVDGVEIAEMIARVEAMLARREVEAGGPTAKPPA